MTTVHPNVEKFVRRWFAELTGDDQYYDIPTLGGEDYDVHYTLEAFAEDLLDLIKEAEAAARKSEARS